MAAEEAAKDRRTVFIGEKHLVLKLYNQIIMNFFSFVFMFKEGK